MPLFRTIRIYYFVVKSNNINVSYSAEILRYMICNNKIVQYVRLYPGLLVVIFVYCFDMKYIFSLWQNARSVEQFGIGSVESNSLWHIMYFMTGGDCSMVDVFPGTEWDKSIKMSRIPSFYYVVLATSVGATLIHSHYLLSSDARFIIYWFFKRVSILVWCSND